MLHLLQDWYSRRFQYYQSVFLKSKYSSLFVLIFIYLHPFTLLLFTIPDWNLVSDKMGLFLDKNSPRQFPSDTRPTPTTTRFQVPGSPSFIRVDFNPIVYKIRLTNHPCFGKSINNFFPSYP